MANPHFAKLADVWKHLPLLDILSRERPVQYWESHAGSAAYEMSDDAERRFGAIRFWEHSVSNERLRSTRYLYQLRQLNPDGQMLTYPGSCLLAMAELGESAAYVFCDGDLASASDLKAWAELSGLAAHVMVIAGDGLDVLHEGLASADPTSLLVHIDPFDPWAKGSKGVSALELAAEVADAGARLVYWYGYDQPGERAWALDEIGDLTAAHLWCGDVMVASLEGSPVDGNGNLGEGTTPGTGCGIVCANLTEESARSCGELGEAISRVWRGLPLPTGASGRLDFSFRPRD